MFQTNLTIVVEGGLDRRLTHRETSFMVVAISQARSSEHLNHGIGSGNGGEEIASKDIKEVM